MMHLFFLAALSFFALRPHGGDRVYYTLAPSSDSTMTLTVRMHDHDVQHLQRDVKTDIAEHLLQHIAMKNNGTACPLAYLGSSATRGDALWKFRVVLAPSKIDTLSVMIDSFVDVAPKMENVVTITTDTTVSYALNAQRTSFTHIFHDRTQHDH